MSDLNDAMQLANANPKLVINSQTILSIATLLITVVAPAVLALFSGGVVPTTAEIIQAVIAAVAAYFGVKGRMGATQAIQGVFTAKTEVKPLTYVKQ